MVSGEIEGDTMATTAEEVWQLLAELTTAQKETERRFQ